MPAHQHIRRTQVDQWRAARGAQQELVVLRVAAGDLLVDQPEPGAQRNGADQERGRVQLGHPVAQQIGEGDRVPGQHPVDGVPVVADPDAAADQLRVGGLGQRLDLGP
ncbi:hypothetical protein GCM10027614_77020 [Micromonospora vulcania]